MQAACGTSPSWRAKGLRLRRVSPKLGKVKSKRLIDCEERTEREMYSQHIAGIGMAGAGEREREGMVMFAVGYWSI